MIQEKLKWKFTSYLVRILSLSLLFNCSKKTDFQRLSEIVYSKYESQINDFNTIIVLEENTCIPCNKAYAELVEKNIKDSVLLIVAATGSQYQIDVFRTMEKGKVIFDYANTIKKEKILSTSGAIFLNNNSIDTIIQINDPKTLLSKLKYFEQRINKF